MSDRNVRHRFEARDGPASSPPSAYLMRKDNASQAEAATQLNRQQNERGAVDTASDTHLDKLA